MNLLMYGSAGVLANNSTVTSTNEQVFDNVIYEGAGTDSLSVDTEVSLNASGAVKVFRSNLSSYNASFGSIVTDASGNIYAADESNVFKFDPQFNLLWKKTGGGVVVIDSISNVYVVGITKSSGLKITVLKLDSNGNKLNYNYYPITMPSSTSSTAHYIFDAKIDSTDALVMVGGWSVSSAYFPFLCKIDSTGTMNYCTRAIFADPANVNWQFQKLAIDASNNIYVAANLRSEIGHGQSVSIYKFNAAGSLLESGAPIKLDQVGNNEFYPTIVLANSNIYYVTSTTSATFVAKLSTLSTVEWCKKISSTTSTDYAYGRSEIAVDQDDNIYVTHSTHNTNSSDGLGYFAIAKFDLAGNVISTKALTIAGSFSAGGRGGRIAFNNNLAIAAVNVSDGSYKPSMVAFPLNGDVSKGDIGGFVKFTSPYKFLSTTGNYRYSITNSTVVNIAAAIVPTFDPATLGTKTEETLTVTNSAENYSMTVTSASGTNGNGFALVKRLQSSSDWQLKTSYHAANEVLIPNAAGSQSSSTAITEIKNGSIVLGPNDASNLNAAANRHLALVFKEDAAFMRMFNWTGSGITPAAETLGMSVPVGFVMVTGSGGTDPDNKTTIWHRSMTGAASPASNGTEGGTLTAWPYGTQLDLTSGDVLNLSNYLSVSSSEIRFSQFKSAGVEYTGIVFGHDASENGLVQCGKFTSTGNIQEIALGWEPDALLIFAHNRAVNGSTKLVLTKAMGLGNLSNSAGSLATSINLGESNQETGASLYWGTSSNGILEKNTNSSVWYYVALRKRVKANFTSADVFTMQKTDTTAYAAKNLGKSDMVLLVGNRTNTITGHRYALDRHHGIRGAGESGTNRFNLSLTTAGRTLETADLNPSATSPSAAYIDKNGNMIMSAGGQSASLFGAIGYGFKEAKGFFSICHHEGLATPRHGLGAVPEFVLTVPLNSSGNRGVYCKSMTAGKEMNFTSNAGTYNRTLYNGDPDINYLYINSVGSSQIATATVSNAGSGYTGTPTLSLSGGGGTGGVLTAVMVPNYTGAVTLNGGAYGFLSNGVDSIFSLGVVGNVTGSVSTGNATATFKNGADGYIYTAFVLGRSALGAGYTLLKKVNNGNNDLIEPYPSVSVSIFAKNNSTDYIFESTGIDNSGNTFNQRNQFADARFVYKLSGQGYVITGTTGNSHLGIGGNGSLGSFGSVLGTAISTIACTYNQQGHIFVGNDNNIYRSAAANTVCDYGTINTPANWVATGHNANSVSVARENIAIASPYSTFVIVPRTLNPAGNVFLYFSAYTAAPATINIAALTPLPARSNVVPSGTFICAGTFEETSRMYVVYGTDSGYVFFASDNYGASWSLIDGAYAYKDANVGISISRGAAGNGVLLLFVDSNSATVSARDKGIAVASNGFNQDALSVPNNTSSGGYVNFHYKKRIFTWIPDDLSVQVVGYGCAIVTLTSAGTGYAVAPNFTSTYYSGPTGQRTNYSVTGRFDLVTNGNKIGSVTITNAGSGYTSAPTVSVSGGGGTGGAVTVTLGSGTGYVGNITVNNGGSNYDSAPTVSFSGGGGTGVTATANMVDNFTGALTLRLNYPGWPITYPTGTVETPTLAGVIGTATTTQPTGNAVVAVRNGGGSSNPLVVGYSKTGVVKKTVITNSSFVPIFKNTAFTPNYDDSYFYRDTSLEKLYVNNDVTAKPDIAGSANGIQINFTTTANMRIYRLFGSAYVVCLKSGGYGSAVVTGEGAAYATTLGGNPIVSVAIGLSSGMAITSTGAIYRFTEGATTSPQSTTFGALSQPVQWASISRNTTIAVGVAEVVVLENVSGASSPGAFAIVPSTIIAGTANVTIERFTDSATYYGTVSLPTMVANSNAGGTIPERTLLCCGITNVGWPYLVYNTGYGLLHYRSSNNGQSWTSVTLPAAYAYSATSPALDVGYATTGNGIVVAVVKSSSANSPRLVFAYSESEESRGEDLYTSSGTPGGLAYYTKYGYFALFKSNCANEVFGHGNAMLSLTSAGTGYVTQPAFTITNATNNVAAAGYLNLEKLGKKVSSVTVNTAGTGYSSAPTVSFSGGNGTGATATASLVTGNSYVTGVSITNNGTGYTTAPTVTFTGGGGNGASGTANLVFQALGPITGGAVSTVTASGGSYTAAPTVTFSGGNGTGAVATAILSGTSNGGNVITNGTLTTVTVNSGGQYNGAPTAAVVPNGSGSGATVTVTLSATANGGNVSLGTVTSITGDLEVYCTTPLDLIFTGGGGTGAAGYLALNSTSYSGSNTNDAINSGRLTYTSSTKGYVSSVPGLAAVNGPVPTSAGNSSNGARIQAQEAVSQPGGKYVVLFKPFTDNSMNTIVNGSALIAKGSGYRPGSYLMYIPGAIGSNNLPVKIVIDGAGMIDYVELIWSGNNGSTVYEIETNLNDSAAQSAAPGTVFPVTVGGGTGGSVKFFAAMQQAAAYKIPENAYVVAANTTQMRGQGYVQGSVTKITLPNTAPFGLSAPVITVGSITPLLYKAWTGIEVITNPGSGYTSAPTVTTRALASNEVIDYGSVLTAVLTYASSPYTYPVQSINVTAAGSGYLSSPTVALSGGKTQKFATVTSVVLANNEMYYASAPTVSFSGGGGTGAAATVVIGTNEAENMAPFNSGSIESYTVTEGYVLASNIDSTFNFNTPTNPGKVATVNINKAAPESKLENTFYCMAPMGAGSDTVPDYLIASRGTGYTPGTYSQNIPNYFAGDGQGTMSVVIAANGTISSVTVSTSGSKYYRIEAPFGTPTPTISITVGGGSGGQVKLFDMMAYCRAYRILNTASVFDNKGTGYVSAQIASLTNISIGSAVSGLSFGQAISLGSLITRPKVTVTSVSPILNRVLSINITSAGSGYTSPPTISLTAPTGYEIGSSTPAIVGITFGAAVNTGTVSVPATITPNMNYTRSPFTYPIASLNLTNGGSGYTGTPTITLGTANGSGGTASVSAMNFTYGPSTYTVGSVTITTPGTGYTSAPSVSFSGGGGTGVAATASISVGAATEYVSYCWATVPGVSKIGTSIGNGTTQNVECNFSNGSRLIIIKSESTGYWYAFDSLRGITASNDPAVILDVNGNLAERVYDSVDPYAGGFALQYNANVPVNSNGEKYIFMAIA
jgi:hypothetical protein